MDTIRVPDGRGGDTVELDEMVVEDEVDNEMVDEEVYVLRESVGVGVGVGVGEGVGDSVGVSPHLPYCG